jgi:peroxiredoxin
MSSIPTAGTAAPDFTLRVTPDQTSRSLRGKSVILAFYPADWSPVCGDQVTLYNEILPEFHRHNAELLGISVDGVWCHAAFARDRRLHFPLLSDFEPKGADGILNALENLSDQVNAHGHLKNADHAK